MVQPVFNYLMDQLQVNDHIDQSKEVAIGVVAAMAMRPICTYVATLAEEGLKASGKVFEYPADDVIRLFEDLTSLQGNALMTALRITGQLALTTLLVVIEPVVKEAIFRGWIHDRTKSLQEWVWGPRADSTIQKIVRVVISGVIFGSYHLSPFQGWANIPIFVATGSAGIVLAALKEWRGNSTSNVTAHMIHNVIALTQLVV